MAYAFTNQQKTDIRRYMGYPPAGTDMNQIVFGICFNASGELEYRLDRLTAEEGACVITMLDQIKVLDEEIDAARDNLDTLQVAVIQMNPKELRARRDLLDYRRLRLCEMVGLPAGPYLRRGPSGRMVV